METGRNIDGTKKASPSVQPLTTWLSRAANGRAGVCGGSRRGEAASFARAGPASRMPLSRPLSPFDPRSATPPDFPFLRSLSAVDSRLALTPFDLVRTARRRCELWPIRGPSKHRMAISSAPLRAPRYATDNARRVIASAVHRKRRTGTVPGGLNGNLRSLALSSPVAPSIVSLPSS